MTSERMDFIQTATGTTVFSFTLWSNIPAEYRTGIIAALVNLLIIVINYYASKIKRAAEIDHVRKIESAKAEARIETLRSLGVPMARDTKEMEPVNSHDAETVNLATTRRKKRHE